MVFVPVELLPVQLIQLTHNILDGILRPWNNHMLDRINPPIHDLDHIIQNHKRSLQARKFYERLHCPLINLSRLLDLLTTATETRELELAATIGGVGFELGEEDTGYVFLLGADAERGGFDGFLDLVGDGGASGVGGFGEGERGDGHDSAHFEFGVIDAAGDFAETSVGV